MKSETEKNILKKKPSQRKVIIFAGVLVVLAIVCLVYILSIDQDSSGPDPASEALIRQAAARQLGINPDELTNEDFTLIKQMNIYSSVLVIRTPGTKIIPQAKNLSLSDVQSLKHFINLEELQLLAIYYPQDKIPKWMKIMAGIGVIDLNDRFWIDLKGLENLSSLRKLDLSNSAIVNIEPLANLKNLEELNLTGTYVSELRPLRNLKNLKVLNINDCKNIKNKQIDGLQKALPGLLIVW